jgi:hypothetical protein
MNRLIRCLVSAFAILCAGTVHAQPPEGGNPFDRFDTNKDGKLSRDEMPEFVRDRFSEIDTNKDGFVSRQEDDAFFRNGPGGPGGGSRYRRPSRPRRTFPMPPRKIRARLWTCTRRRYRRATSRCRWS